MPSLPKDGHQIPWPGVALASWICAVSQALLLSQGCGIRCSRSHRYSDVLPVHVSPHLCAGVFRQYSNPRCHHALHPYSFLKLHAHFIFCPHHLLSFLPMQVQVLEETLANANAKHEEDTANLSRRLDSLQRKVAFLFRRNEKLSKQLGFLNKVAVRYAVP